MVVLFIVIANEALKCYGIRFCEPASSVELVRLWEIGAVEVMFEGVLGNQAIKVYRRIKDKFKLPEEDRTDKIFTIKRK